MFCRGKHIRRRPAVVFRATEMRFPARATSRLALAPYYFIVFIAYRVQLLPCTTYP